MKFEDRLKELRIENKYSQIELGKKIGASNVTISQYESGTRKPDIDTINELANFFNVTTDYLLGRSNIRNPYSNDDLSLSDHDVIAAHGKTEKVELSEEDLQDIQDFLKQMRKDK